MPEVSVILAAAQQDDPKAAAEAMRRIHVEKARQKISQKQGGALQRVELADAPVTAKRPPRNLHLHGRSPVK